MKPPGRSGEVERTLHRRRLLLLWLVIAATASLTLALVTGRPPFWAAQVTADVLLAGYLGALIHARNAAAEQEMARHGLRA